MSAVSHAEALLLEVMGIAPEDAQLPLQVLINLHRERLRAPLEALAETCGGNELNPYLRAQHALAETKERWPELEDGSVFDKDEQLNLILDELENVNSPVDERNAEDIARHPSPTAQALLRMDRLGWQCCEPLILLHQLTHRDIEPHLMALHVGLLERELELDPAVEDMIRTFAQL
jgi:hypothetical protein